MTFSILRALHAILADALADIEAVYADAATPDLAPPSPPPPPPTHSRTASRAYASPPPSPGVPPPAAACIPPAPFDFPALDSPYDPASPAEQLTTHPRVVAAINRIVAAAGQMAATVQVPFLTLCDASMGYHLPSCLRLFEAAHIADILRDGPPSGVHVAQIAQETGVDQAKLGGSFESFFLSVFIRRAYIHINLSPDSAHPPPPRDAPHPA
ncbi:hypothetical protein B0H10DRAFT_1360709 [Mycena sp. CBHHK59/15]|nr:hypothetical protein B0H10DRAFT_1360709 [Mycena sp. CBHHK59/15]